MSDAQGFGVAEAASSGEVEVANTATSRARSEAVLRLAMLTINIHTEAVQEARVLAEKLDLRAAPSIASGALREEADDATSHLVLTAIDAAPARTNGTVPVIRYFFIRIMARTVGDFLDDGEAAARETVQGRRPLRAQDPQRCARLSPGPRSPSPSTDP